MSLIPNGAGLHQDCWHKWGTIRYALDKTSRTIRLCVILLVSSAATVITAGGTLLVVAVVHGWLG